MMNLSGNQYNADTHFSSIFLLSVLSFASILILETRETREIRLYHLVHCLYPVLRLCVSLVARVSQLLRVD